MKTYFRSACLSLDITLESIALVVSTARIGFADTCHLSEM